MDRLTRTHKIWLTLGAVAVTVVAVLVCMAALPTRAPAGGQPAEIEIDIDVDKPKVIKTTKPVVVPTPARPLPRTTRR